MKARVGALACCALVAGAGADTYALYERRPLPAPLMGLVEVPALFAREGSDAMPAADASIALRAAPHDDAPVVGRADANGLFAAEYAYEVAGALVVGRREAWYRVVAAGMQGELWLAPADAGRFLDIETLVHDWSYLTADWDRRLAETPGGAAHTLKIARETEVQVLDSRRQAGMLWLHVRLLGRSACEAGEDLAQLPELARGWVPLLAPSGRPNLWFYSRGC